MVRRFFVGLHTNNTPQVNHECGLDKLIARNPQRSWQAEDVVNRNIDTVVFQQSAIMGKGKTTPPVAPAKLIADTEDYLADHQAKSDENAAVLSVAIQFKALSSPPRKGWADLPSSATATFRHLTQQDEVELLQMTQETMESRRDVQGDPQTLALRRQNVWTEWVPFGFTIMVYSRRKFLALRAIDPLPSALDSLVWMVAIGISNKKDCHQKW
ncbi:hypothetical protein CHU98_g11309 [Xylaria longipes]|nr:hypothetical protein CHU98_g11309 [Xylaria longipes]